MSIRSIAGIWKTCDDKIRTYLYGPEHDDNRGSTTKNHDERSMVSSRPVIVHMNADGEWRICKAKEGHCIFEHRQFSSVEELSENNRGQ